MNFASILRLTVNEECAVLLLMGGWFMTVQKGAHVPKGVEAVRNMLLLSNLHQHARDGTVQADRTEGRAQMCPQECIAVRC